MAYENPPQDASPKNLLAVCGGLTDGSRSVDELSDDVDLGLSKSVISDTMRYGVRMGFITQDDDGNLSLSDRGWDIAFVDEIDESVEEPFRVGIQDYALYTDLLDKIIEEGLAEQGEPSQVTQKQILPLLNRSFGFSELSTESTLKPATNTFLQTLDAAGYGKYVVGRRESPTRIELNDEFLQLVRDNQGTDEEEPHTGDSERSDDIDDEADEDGREERDESHEDESPAPDHEINTTVAGTEVNIEIQVSSADWSSDEVVELIDSLKADE